MRRRIWRRRWPGSGGAVPMPARCRDAARGLVIAARWSRWSPVSRELRRSFAMRHLPYGYDLGGEFFVPFVLGVDDAAGDNIADRAAFSEARGHYWLWKN